MRIIDFPLRGEHIALDALLKASGVAASGGVAKVSIVGGDVAVNGEAETRRGRKVRVGDVVEWAGVDDRVRIVVGAARETP